MSDFKITFKQLPLEIKMLYWYSIILGVASCLLLVPQLGQWYKETFPYPAWRPSFLYLFMAQIIFFIPLRKDGLNILDKMRKYLVFDLGLILTLEIINWMSEDSKDYYLFNRYLNYDSLYIVFGIIIPLSFLIIIGFPLIKNILKKKSNASV